MNILLVLIPVTLLIVLVAIGLFFWAVNHQQFDDMDSPGILPLMEDDPVTPPVTPPAQAPMEATDAVPAPSCHTRMVERPPAQS